MKKVIQVMRRLISVAFVTAAGFVGGELAWLLEGAKYDWGVKGALATIAAGLIVVAISLIVQCFPNSSRLPIEVENMEVIQKDK
jgi:CHASE2 domain-containing sensor protein